MSHTHYNAIAGQSVERLAALSDGVFAVALTLLVLDLKIPAADAIHAETDLIATLAALAPHLLVYLMSFLTLGIFWVGQQTQHNHLARSDRSLTWLNLAFLFAVSLMPFTTSLIGELTRYRTALLIYWANIAILGLLLHLTWHCAWRSGLLRETATTETDRFIRRRILVAQALYAVGALLCTIDSFVSIGFIVLVQLNYVLAPRIGVLSRL